METLLNPTTTQRSLANRKCNDVYWVGFMLPCFGLIKFVFIGSVFEGGFQCEGRAFTWDADMYQSLQKVKM